MRWATSLPILPNPTIANVLPSSSLPMYCKMIMKHKAKIIFFLFFFFFNISWDKEVEHQKNLWKSSVEKCLWNTVLPLFLESVNFLRLCATFRSIYMLQNFSYIFSRLILVTTLVNQTSSGGCWLEFVFIPWVQKIRVWLTLFHSSLEMLLLKQLVGQSHFKLIIETIQP